jgi:tetratricopeptide (TPR) repeat protein
VRLGLVQHFGAQTANALASFDEAVALLEPLDAALDLTQARVARAFTLFLLGQLEPAEREADVALVLAQTLGEAALVAGGCRVKGLALVQSGRREEGRELQRRALEVALRLGKPTLQAAAHNNLALCENHLGNFRAAEAGYESALALWRELNMTVNIGRAMHNLGAVATRRGDHATALERYQAALEVLVKAGERNLVALNLMSTGDALVRLGRPREARVPLARALRMAERDGHMLPALDSHIVLAQAAVALGEYPEAARHLATALDGAREHHFANVLADAVVASARLVAAARPAQAARALAWAGDVARLPETSVSVREDARALGGDGPAAAAPRPLEELAREARAAVGALSAPRGVTVQAP